MKYLLTALMCLPSHAMSDFTKIGRKTLHVAGGFAIAYTGKRLGYPKTGLALGIAAGIGKEVYDYRRSHESTPSMVNDVFITGSGAYIAFSFKF